MIKYCERCGAELQTSEEKDHGLCDDCYEEEEMNNLASAILNTPEIPPDAEDL